MIREGYSEEVMLALRPEGGGGASCGKMPPGRGISGCKDPEKERNLESVRVKGAGVGVDARGERQARGQKQPQNLQRKGGPVFLLRNSL